MSEVTYSLEELTRQIRQLRAELDDRKSNDIIAEETPAMIVNLKTGIIRRATQPLDELFGYIEGYLLGKNIEVMIPERLREVHKKHFESYRDHPIQRTMGKRGMDLVGLHRSGIEFPIQITLRPRMYLGDESAVAVVWSPGYDLS